MCLRDGLDVGPLGTQDVAVMLVVYDALNCDLGFLVGCMMMMTKKEREEGRKEEKEEKEEEE